MEVCQHFCPSLQLAFFLWHFFLCFLFAFSKFYPIANALVISSILFQFLASRPYIALFSSISLFPTFFCRLGFYFVFLVIHIIVFIATAFCILPYRHLHLFICFFPPGLRYSLPCYQLFVTYAFHFSFYGMRSSLVCFLMTDVLYCILFIFCFLCFCLEKFSLLLLHSRC